MPAATSLAPANEASATLYQRVLGRDFAKLPGVLQQFHGNLEGGFATGTLVVERGAGIARGLMGKLLNLPDPGTQVRLRLQVIPEGGKERWIRHFGHKRIESLQWQEGPYLFEKVGPISLAFLLTADSNGLKFQLAANRTMGWNLPSSLSLRVAAHALGAQEQWRVEVSIKVPLLGQITTYSGLITPTPC